MMDNERIGKAGRIPNRNMNILGYLIKDAFNEASTRG